MARSLIHPRMLSKLGSFYPSRCSIQRAMVTKDSYGQDIPSWLDFGAYVNIPCAVSPSGGQEVTRPDMTVVVSSHTIALAGYCPAITTAHRAVVDGTSYNILSVERDQLGSMTRLRCQIVAPEGTR